LCEHIKVLFIFIVCSYVRCKEYKSNRCPATGSISINMNENAFFIKKLHNHRARIDDTPVSELRNILGEQCVDHSPTPFQQNYYTCKPSKSYV